MKKITFIVLCLIGMLTSCDETTDTVGSSLTSKEDIITVSDDVFQITSRSIAVDSVLSRNALGYLGKVKDPETGTYVKSNFLTQFTILEGNNGFVNRAYLGDNIQADSCDLRLFYNSYFGDSLTTMKATIYEMRKPVEEGVNYYSSFDPEAAGMVRVGEGLTSRVFCLANTNYSDSLRATTSYTNNIRFQLDDPYTDVDGNTYNNYGTYIMRKYYENPSNFNNTNKFLHNVCPGFYIKLENGVGAMAYVSNSRMFIHYNYTDTTKHYANQQFRGTEEVRQLTNISNDNTRLQALANDKTCTYIKSPAGIFTELTLPVSDICKGHEKDSINSAKFTLNCYNKVSESDYAFSAPKTLLLLEKDSLQSFFENRELTNYRSTFTASYASATNTYTFNNIGQLIRTMYDNMSKGVAKDPNWIAAHPNWNKVMLVPVTATYTTYSSTSVLSSITHDMGMSSVRLVGGPENTQGDISIAVIYSKY